MLVEVRLTIIVRSDGMREFTGEHQVYFYDSFLVCSLFPSQTSQYYINNSKSIPRA